MGFLNFLFSVSSFLVCAGAESEARKEGRQPAAESTGKEVLTNEPVLIPSHIAVSQ